VTDGPVPETLPARPRPGTLFEVVVPTADSLAGGTVAGEPLHFVRRAGRWRAWAAAPVDSGEVTVAVVRCARAGCDTLQRRVVLAPSPYRVERLRVAPRFGAPPDSATQARIDAEFALARAVSRRAHATPVLWREPFRAPRASRVTSGFGTGRSFNGRITSRHTGVDYAGAVGAPVLAANRGVVRLVGDLHYAGRAVYVDHGGGFVTAYFHLSAVAVLEGDTVARGQRVGAVGATGRVTGPHLHFVARYGEVSVDGRSLPGLAPPDRAGGRR
jgi:murein DD-endopeptidase MepM/ murein hydrolase activator NlpD